MNQLSKKLIYILNSYSSTESSHFHHVLGLLEALAKRDIEIVLVIEKAETIPIFSNTNIRVIAIKNHRGIRRYIELFQVVSKLIQEGFTRTFVRIAAPAALTAALAHYLHGGAVFFWQSGTTIEYDAAQPWNIKKMKWFFGSLIPNFLARRYVQYFVTGPAYMVDYYHRVGGVKKEKIRLLYNDIDITRFTPPDNCATQKTAFLATHGYSPDTLILLLVHRLSPVRRTQLYFPSCLQYLRDNGLLNQVLVVVAGTGGELPAIQVDVSALSIEKHCLFLGSVPNREIQQLYAIADIFLHPTYNEGFPRVVLEAMAASLPIVSTDAGGTRELMGELQSAFVVSRDEPLEFFKNLAELVRHAPLRQQLATENRAYVERFSTIKIAKMYDEVLFK